MQRFLKGRVINMKLLFGLLVLPVVAFGLYKQYVYREVIPMTGRRDDHTNSKAPKVIVSKEITAFDYEFSCDFFSFYDREMDFSYCAFELKKEEDNALYKGKGYGNTAAGSFAFEVSVPLSALDDLQVLLDEHKVAESNGVNVFTHGLPAQIGSGLRVRYASGETISARDNSGAAIPNRATIALYDFFVDLALDAGHDIFLAKKMTADFQDKVGGMWRDEEERMVLWIIGSGITIYENDEVVQSVTYIVKDGKAHNEFTDDGHFQHYAYFEWRDNAIYGIALDGSETEFHSFEP